MSRLTAPYRFLSLLLLLFSLLTAAASSSADEVRSLLEFKKGIRSDPLGRVLNSWNQTTPSADPTGCPGFYGVVCDDSGSVAAINLDRLGLVGDLKFFTLSGLKMLKNLSLSGNSLTGRLVPALGSMTSLQHLDLSSNQFYGPIPARINDLWALNYLNLSNNNFSSGFPSGIQNLQQLKVLDLHSNDLWGDVQDLIPELRNVEYIDLSYNGFYGSVSLDVQNLSALCNTAQYVNFSHNRLSGGFFKAESIGLFRNLKVLDLGDNEISGELPPFGSLPSLRVLLLGNNQLYGSIPEELLESSIPLQELDLSGNGFSGEKLSDLDHPCSCPVHSVNSSSLRLLNLSSNMLAGSLPSSLGTCLIVDLSRNLLSDDISIMQSWGDTLEVLELSSNKLTGSIPNLTSQFQRLSTLNLRNNSLAGVLPPLIGTYPRLSAVDLSFNEFDGPLPSSFFTSMTLTNLNLSGNHFTGTIPLQGSHTSELLVLPSYPLMESLDLSENSLTGSLPSEIANLGRLKVLNLAKNQLTGQLPKELSKLSGLEYLDISKNDFKGHIPDKLPLSLKVFNVSYNDLSGRIPENLRKFPDNSFRPGNALLIFLNGRPSENDVPAQIQERGKHQSSKSTIRIAIIVASVGAAFMIAFVLLAYYRAQLQDFRVRSGFSGQTTGRDVKVGRFSRPSLFKFHPNVDAPPTSLSFSNDHLLTSNSRSLSGPPELGTEIVEHALPGGVAASSAPTHPNLMDSHLATSGRKSSPGSPIATSPRFSETIEQPVTLDVYSPDRLAGELYFLDASLAFTAEDLSRAPAEVLGRSSHGTLYKATLDSGHMLTVKWLRVGLVKFKKEFAKEVKKIGSIRHPNVVPLRAYYWGPREQERLILADYVQGDSLALHLYETTPRRYTLLSFSQRLKVAVDVARGLLYLHERSLPHGNLKPTNILLAGSDFNAYLTDYGLYRLMTPAGTAEQILNLGALGYRAPELANTTKPIPSSKADVYAFGVILMELLTRRSAGDIISGQSGAVDLTDWVRLCDQEGRGMDCIDRDIAGGEEHSKGMDELLAISLRCILPVNERPNIRQVFEEIGSISA
ncbi:hypothetical protein RJ639_020956 [Escallonia herrerae]|uniref:Protein kinase domain-containing protein n=1 Tax=Escallonia herrerae TaxID=1293975 RepID=A0AA88V6Z2_9ASTE|nr:hypothetical protein RJ639_020956 [Escallonia herrerae]